MKDKPSVATEEEDLGTVQPDLLSLMGSYRDLYYPEDCPVTRGPQVRTTYCLHVLNHVLKANSQVLANNAQLREHKSKKGAEVVDEPRDQGLTRPKVRRSLTAVYSSTSNSAPGVTHSAVWINSYVNANIVFSLKKEKKNLIIYLTALFLR